MTAADRPSVTDDARAEAMARELLVQTLTANPDEAASESSWEWARRIVGRLLAAGRAETTTDDLGDAYMLGYAAAGRAETTTATVEDAARVLYESGTGFKLTKGKPWEELAESSRNSQRRLAQSLADAGLLATARTRPTREQIREALSAWDDADAYEAADAVLALLEGGDDQ